MTKNIADIDSAELLLKVLANIETEQEAKSLLEDLCTPREIEDLAQRIRMAVMLENGESYTVIQDKTGASATTVARVSRALNFGSGGYKLALKRIKDDLA